MASSVPLTNILDPSAAADQIQLDRRMRMAEMLRQQAMAPEQQQAAGGYVIPYSPFQGLAKLAQGYMAGKIDEGTDKQRAEMAQRQSKMLMDALRGPQAQPDTRFQGVTGMGVDTQGNVTNTPQDFNAQFEAGKAQPAPQQAAPSQFDLPNLLRGNAISQLGGDQAGSAYWEGMKPTTEMKNAQWMQQDPRLLAALDIAKRRKEGMVELQPGTTSLDLATGRERFQPKVGEGITINNGVATQLPGYGPAAANIAGAQAGAVEGAKAEWNPQTYQLPQGLTVLTQAQAARGAQGKGGAQGIPLQTTTQAAQDKAAAQAAVDLPKTIDTSNQLIDNINSLIAHPALKTAVGHIYSGAVRQVPGTESADFAAREAQIGGQTFLNAYQSLKGGGQITEIEGAKAEAALKRARQTQSPEDYVKAMTDYRDVIQKGVERAKQTAKGSFNPALPSMPASAGGAKFLGFE